MDADGTYSFSRVAAVQLEGYVGIHLSLSGHPSNKTEIELLIEYGDPSLAAAAATVELRDLQGRLQTRQQVDLINGTNRVRIPASGLSPGTYLIQVRNASLAHPLSLRAVKQ
ncbi:T9SS type A sorting domain-containing protein [Siphonobacter aquaeclarae]|uniref:Por secretion system C-terminal sorting domain-containing protein n=1 Tax=Siphonobacter aquaeclarae TaxID=563176 RepID=A0A1G9RV42_9BACT|nr:T9SS type A sorting domain-containing protein [Siphonobacter aquaeclarae]SDM26375.1 Por secretion system C-terminal sorting domain-containing protein [Siphonobacter aquaeclarae]